MLTSQSVRRPVFTALQNYLQEQVLPFHTPGHKQGKGAHESLRAMLGQSALSLDLTFVPGISDLFDQQGPIQESQRMAAALYGADQSFFLVNGTTGGIYAMILATVGPGEKIIVPRNIHRSVMGGLILSGAVPVFVQPEVDQELQIAMNVDAAAFEAAIRANPDAKAVLLINPTYYGVAAQLQRITDFAHRAGMAVLVDEAHGPHLHFSAELPLQGITAGADIVVQSTHKLLGSLSQSSILHCRRGRIDIPRLGSMLQLTQSSSPNYLLLLSLEAAVVQLLESGGELIGKSVRLAKAAREEIARIPGLACLDGERLGQPGVAGLDWTKLLVNVSRLGLRGNEAEHWLRREGKVQAELSDANHVLFLVTLADEEASITSLTGALADMARRARPSTERWESPAVTLPRELAPLRMTPREATFSRRERIGFAGSAGRICAETITCYPPGIPLLFPGEEITPEAIVYGQELRRQGFCILGPEDPALKTVGVVA